jgi:hypothetical protein
MATDAQTSPVTRTSEPARPSVSEEPERLDWSGVVPSDAAYRPARASEPDGPREVPPDVIVEVAPPRKDAPPPSEQEPSPYEPSEVITEVGPEVIPEVAPEVRPAEEDPGRPYEPSEVITEVAPEIQPSETEAERPRSPSEVITEIAPEVAPER